MRVRFGQKRGEQDPQQRGQDDQCKCRRDPASYLQGSATVSEGYTGYHPEDHGPMLPALNRWLASDKAIGQPAVRAARAVSPSGIKR